MRKLFCFLIFAVSLSAIANAQDDDSVWFESYEQIDYNELRNLIDEGQIDSARVLRDGWWVTVRTKEGEFFDTKVTPQTPIADHLYDAGIPVKFEHWSEDDDEMPLWLRLFLNVLPLIIFIAFVGVVHFGMKKANTGYYSRAEKLQNEFLDRLEKLLIKKEPNG